MSPPSRSSAVVSDLLGQKGVTQSDLARGTGTPRSYVSKIVNGTKLPSAEWIELATSTMALQEGDKQRLLRAAGADLAERWYGVDLDLTKE